MIAEAIRELLNLAPIQRATIGAAEYVKQSQGVTRLKKPEEIVPDALSFSTLSGLRDYIKANPDGLDLTTLFLHVSAFNRVELVGPLQRSNDNRRFIYALAAAVDMAGGFEFGKWMEPEDFIVKMHTGFARYDGIEDDCDTMIANLSKIANEKIKTLTDNGLTQVIQIRDGLTTLSSVKVENPVRVRPWRTFAEIEQPEMVAVYRFKKTGAEKPMAALFESGSNLWKLTAINAIGGWLHEALPDLDILM